jgi:hypothetical protein
MSSVLLDLWRDLDSWLREFHSDDLLSPAEVLEHIKEMEDEYI